MSALWIAGQWTEARGGRQGNWTNPSTGESLPPYADGSIDDGLAAIESARGAFDRTTWARQPRRRAAVLLQLAERLERIKAQVAATLSAENGKLLAEAEHEVTAAVSELRYYAGLARNVFGRLTELEPGSYSALVREPLGVAAIIVPWNAPITLLIRSLAPAIAAGCTSVVKVAPQTAATSSLFFRLFDDMEAVPAGAVNMVTESGSEIAQALVSSRMVDVVSYTGSTAVGKKIMAAGAATLKRLNLELGGNAPCVVFADADLDRACEGIVRAALSHAGQVCVAASRVIVHKGVEERFAGLLADRLAATQLGRANDRSAAMGPLINEASCDRLRQLVTRASVDGEILLQGAAPDAPVLAGGAFLSPSLVRVRRRGAELLREEVFGPVLSLTSFDDENEAVAIANDSDFGLAASAWTRDLARGQRMGAAIRAGTVWINQHLRMHAEIETGGFKESGLGRLHGVEGLDAFLQTKHVAWQV